MATKPVIHVVGTECPPEMEEEFDRWYSERHVPDLLKFQGLKKVTRYKILRPNEDYPMFLTIYEFESREQFEAYATSPERTAAAEDWRKIQEELKASQKWGVQFETIKTWEQ